MNRQEQSKLKFDRRLRNRPGWVSEEEMGSELETLSDAASNVAEEDEEDLGKENTEASGPAV